MSNPIGVYVCHFLGQGLGCAYTICWRGQISISCTSPSGSRCPLSCVSPCTPSVLICCIYSLRVFHITISWWFFTGVWMTASHLNSPGLLSVFWSFTTLLYFGWSSLVIQLSSPPVPLILFTNPYARAGYDTRSIFKLSLTGFNSEFSFSKTSCLINAEEPSLSYYLPIAGGRIIGFIPFPRVLVLCEMQPVSSRIWTRVAMFISYDDNNYTMGTSSPF